VSAPANHNQSTTTATSTGTIDRKIRLLYLLHGDRMKAIREPGSDDSEAAFDRRLKQLAAAPPPKSAQKRKTKKKAK
jgi:hypothetical protein